ncbi:MAG: bifunctional pyr operon transcriptional regulator/uracil phosphoribosyltransferase PyrR [Negativicutes bacterium]|nr:bifunctional pyr operon transcriptional regulator/uracil phosphoribosyltransferase PyrR [Negativicutes bacterium]
MANSTLLLDEIQIRRIINRLAHEIIEKNGGCANLVFVGIKRRGLPLAQRLAEVMERVEGIRIACYEIDITPYRDDHKKQPLQGSELTAAEITGKTVVLVDDVLHTGRTVRAALDGVMKWGRPERIQLAVLIDRGHRELPIRPDFVGKNIPTSKLENIEVEITEIDGKDQVILRKPGDGST